MRLPDRMNPRVWLRDAVSAIARWLMRPTREEVIRNHTEIILMWMDCPGVTTTADALVSNWGLDPEALLRVQRASAEAAPAGRWSEP